MTERPILFRPEMVRAILDGRKTQTRRVLNPQPPAGFELFSSGLFYTFTPGGARGPGVEGWTTRCPFVHVDRLWVREAWRADSSRPEETIYLADADAETREQLRGAVAFKPSIHMPRSRCRLVLEVVDVRVERVQQISEDDARAEGMPRDPAYRASVYHFRHLWDTMRARTPFAWDRNPWVWVVEFRVAETVEAAA